MKISIHDFWKAAAIIIFDQQIAAICKKLANFIDGRLSRVEN